MNSVAQGLGASLRRAPYVWLVATILLLLVMNDTLEPIAREHRPVDTWMVVLSVLYGVGSVGAWIVLPRHLRSHAGVSDREDRVVITRWLFACTPYLAGYTSAVAGATTWLWAVGFLTTIVLLVVSARRTRWEAVAER